ncbi:hypothetical protein ScPMuIL_005650 [Solemya velum]
MADYRTTVVLVLIQIVAIDIATAGYKITPSQCKEEYDRCVKKQVYPKHECTYDRWECLLQYCKNNAKAHTRTHTQLARLFACVTKHRLPVKMLHLLD